MKLSKDTMDILKNFASINMSILIRPGNKIKTVTPQKNIMAIAKINESFGREVPIYDLNEFLGTCSLFSDPDFNFSDKFVEISENNKEVNYKYAAKEAIVAAPEKDMNFPSPKVVFTLKEKDLVDAIKAASVMSLANVSLIGKDGNIYLYANDTTNANGNLCRSKVGTTEYNFNIVYRTEILKFLPRDYEVSITSDLITKFESKKGDVIYYAAAETGSKFE